jgi:hypothetical protein
MTHLGPFLPSTLGNPGTSTSRFATRKNFHWPFWFRISFGLWFLLFAKRRDHSSRWHTLENLSKRLSTLPLAHLGFSRTLGKSCTKARQYWLCQTGSIFHPLWRGSPGTAPAPLSTGEHSETPSRDRFRCEAMARQQILSRRHDLGTTLSRPGTQSPLLLTTAFLSPNRKCRHGFVTGLYTTLSRPKMANC